jgi:hypothetical protein
MLEKARNFNENDIDTVTQIVNTLLWKYRLLIFLKEKLANNISRQQIINEAQALRKISYEGVGFSSRTKVEVVSTGPNAGKFSAMWNINSINSSFDGFYGRKATVDLYTRKELYLIVKCLEDSLLLIRSCSNDNEALMIADTIFMTICSALDTKSINGIQLTLLSTRE